MFRKMLSVIAVLVLAVSIYGQTEDPVVLKLDFEDEDLGAFLSDSGELELIKVPVAPSGEYVMKATGDDYADVEKYISFIDENAKIAFHYLNHGVIYLRVLARSIEDGENLYYDVKEFTGNEDKWTPCVVKASELKNLIPRQHPEPAEAKYGDVSGKGKNFKNIVFHVKHFVKTSKDPYVLFDNVTIYTGDDKKAPSAPSNIKVEAKDGKNMLTWSKSTDNIGVAYYSIMDGDKEIGKSSIPQYEVKDGKKAYTVVAVDFEGNKSK